jgi:hypothetical protein
MNIIDQKTIDHTWDELFQMSDRDVLLKKFEFRETQSDLSEFIYSAILDKQDDHQETFSWRIILLMDRCFTAVNGELGMISGGAIEKVLKNNEGQIKMNSDTDTEFDFIAWMNKIGQRYLMNTIMNQHQIYCKSFSVSKEDKANFEKTIVEIGLMYRNEMNRMERILN